MKTSDMRIFFKGLRIYAYHGVMPQEHTVGANFIIDLSIKTDFTKACLDDDLDGTINYADVLQYVKAEMSISSLLLEKVAYRICQRLLKEFPSIEEIDIRLSKENPPMGADCTACGISMHCNRP